MLLFYLIRKSVTKDVEAAYTKMETKLKEALRDVSTVSVTVDMWSDKKIRSYLGVTVHYIHERTLKSSLLSCEKFDGQCILKSFYDKM